MKAYRKLITIIIFPYFIIFTLLYLFIGTSLIQTYGDEIFIVLLCLLIVLYISAFISATLVFISSIKNKTMAVEILRLNMIIKLAHILAYILIFLIGLMCMITIFTYGITIILVILDFLTILLSGIIGVAGVIRSVKERKLELSKAIIHGVLQFIYCADVISAIILYSKIKKANIKDNAI